MTILNKTMFFGLILIFLNSCTVESASPHILDPLTPEGFLANMLIGENSEQIATCVTKGECTIMITTSGYTPNFKSSKDTTSGVLGADLTCQEEAKSKGFTGTFKALLAAIGERESSASGSKDWVLAPNINYYSQYSSSDSRVFVEKTNTNGLLPFPLQATLGASSSIEDQFFTGLNTDWTSSGNDCNAWTNATGASFDGGYTGDTASSALNLGLGTCTTSNLARLACIEQ